MTQQQRKHVGFWLDIDDEPVHVLGDPDMSDETAAALANLVRAVRQGLADGTLPKKQKIDEKAEDKTE